jgi:hypothetical protein
MANEALSKLISRVLSSPRWPVSRDAVVEQPTGLDDLIRTIEEDLDLLQKQIDIYQSRASEPAWIDLRISAEHLLLLSTRALPAIGAAVADLYMTVIADTEKTTSHRVDAKLLENQRDELEVLQRRWGQVKNASVKESETKWTLEMLLAISEINTLSVRLLQSLLIE